MLKPAPERARQRQPDLEGTQTRVPGRRAELAPDGLLVEDFAGDELRQGDRLAEERRVTRAALRGGNDGRATGEGHLAVAPQPVRVRPGRWRPRLDPPRWLGEE